jgi:hypothetical protein
MRYNFTDGLLVSFRETARGIKNIVIDCESGAHRAAPASCIMHLM